MHLLLRSNRNLGPLIPWFLGLFFSLPLFLPFGKFGFTFDLPLGCQVLNPRLLKGSYGLFLHRFLRRSIRFNIESLPLLKSCLDFVHGVFIFTLLRDVSIFNLLWIILLLSRSRQFLSQGDGISLVSQLFLLGVFAVRKIISNSQIVNMTSHLCHRFLSVSHQHLVQS
jgi:hypothetical protein